MINITVHNDGKGRDQSFEARCRILDIEDGYGSTQEEAIDELKENVNKKLNQLKSIDFTKITEVAWDDTPIKEYLKKLNG